MADRRGGTFWARPMWARKFHLFSDDAGRSACGDYVRSLEQDRWVMGAPIGDPIDGRQCYRCLDRANRLASGQPGGDS